MVKVSDKLLEKTGDNQQQADDGHGSADHGEACNRLGMCDLRKVLAFEPVL